jgi:formamidopyrimidine-DNA glycosylase
MRQIKYLSDEQWQSLYFATQSILIDWTGLLRMKAAGNFPTKVTAFHEEMAVHGRYKRPCKDCGKSVQRIRYATNECNYCAECQNQGNLLADRALSRLLKKDWPKTLEELDQ